VAKATKHRDALIQYALSFPGAYADHPWGEVVAKIGKKVFVFFGHPPEDAFGMSVKLPQSGGKVLMAPFAEPTGYGLGKSGWVSVRFTASDVIPPTETLCAWIEESFRAVANKTQVKALDAAPPKAPKGRAAAKKSAAKKPTAKKSAAKKPTAKKSAAKKTTAKKSAAKKTTAKKSAAKKTTAKKSAAKKPTAKKSAAKKTTAKKSAPRRRGALRK
jgi:hypothetical protein